MGYRDELGAAQARADAASRELEAEKEARDGDAARIAELERSLAASLEELATLREGAEAEETQAETQKSPSKSKGQYTILLVAASLLLLGLVGAVMFMSIRTDEMPSGYGFEVFAPAEPEFDVSEKLDDAQRAATRYFEGEFLSGPYLRSIRARAVDDEGRNHLKFGDVEYQFAVELQPLPLRYDEGPVGTRAEQVDSRVCEVAISVDTEGIKYPSQFTANIRQISGLGGRCKAERIRPRCTFGDIRKRSLTDGAPKGAMAEVSLSSGGSWHVRIEDQGQELFSQSYPDDC